MAEEAYLGIAWFVSLEGAGTGYWYRISPALIPPQSEHQGLSGG